MKKQIVGVRIQQVISSVKMIHSLTVLGELIILYEQWLLVKILFLRSVRITENMLTRFKEEVMTTGLLREPDQVSGRVAWT